MCVFEALPVVQEALSLLQSQHAVPQSWSQTFSDLHSFYTFVTHQIYLQQRLPLLGASPDALLEHSDDQCSWLEVVEVKCSSPFAANSNPNSPLYVSTYRPSSFPVWHMPQLQWEILCAGPECHSALLCQLYIDGAVIYRVPRDLEYQSSLLRWTTEFCSTYLSRNGRTNKRSPPPVNFFTLASRKDENTYGAFLDHTLRVARSAECLGTLTAEQIQRNPAHDSFFLDS
jgi:hypothetical protein